MKLEIIADLVLQATEMCGFFFFFFGLEGKRKEGLGEGRAMWKNAPSEDSSSFIWPQVSLIHCKLPPSAWVQFCQPG